MVILSQVATQFGLPDTEESRQFVLFRALTGASADAFCNLLAGLMDTASSVTSRTCVTIPFYMDVAEKTVLSGFFGDMDLNHQPYGYVSGCLSRALQLCARAYIYENIPYGPEVIDYTGQINQLPFTTRPIHFCMPMTEVRDEVRARAEKTSMFASLQRMSSKSPDASAMKVLCEEMKNGTCAKICEKPAECDHRGEVLVIDHMVSDISLEQVALVARARNIKIAYGYFFYDEKMLREERGTIQGTGLKFVVDPATDTLRFVGDGDHAGEHTASQYLAMTKKNAIAVDGLHFRYEIMGVKGPVYMYKMVDVTGVPFVPVKVGHPVWRNMKGEFYQVKSYKVKPGHDIKDAKSYDPFEFMMPAKYVEHCLTYACDLPKEVITYQEILNYLNLKSTRVIAANSTIKLPEPISDEMIIHTAYVIFAAAFESRRDEAIIDARLRHDDKARDELTRDGVLSLAAKGVSVAIWDMLRNGSTTLTDPIRAWAARYSDTQILQPSISRAKPYLYYEDVVGSDFTYSLRGIKANKGFHGYERLRGLADPESFLRRMLAKAVALKKNAMADKIREKLKSMTLSAPVEIPSEVSAVIVVEEEKPVVPSVTVEGEVLELADRIVEENAGFVETDLPVRQVNVVDVVRNIPEKVTPTTLVAGPLIALTQAHESLFPGLDDDRSRDASLFHYDDKEFIVSPVRLELTSHQLTGLRPVSVFKPKLVTSHSYDRPQTMAETLRALAARNMNVPKLSDTADVELLVNDTLQKFLDAYCVPDARDRAEHMRKNPVKLTNKNVQLWTSRLKPGALAVLKSKNFSVEEKALTNYWLTLKSTVKPKTTREPLYEYQKVQTVVFHDKDINGYFSPLFMEIRNRINSLLKPNVTMFMQKSNDEIEKFVNQFFRFGEKTFFLENDYDSYDKSQGYRCLAFEWALYEFVGMNFEDSVMWQNGHIECNMLSISAGVRMLMYYQRRSGDATTALGNTVVNMGTVADSYDVGDMDFSIFLGDDSLIAMSRPVDTHGVSETMASKYGLSAKATVSEHGYICSNYIVPGHTVGEGVRVMPDPVKKLVRFGFCNTDKEEKMREKYDSYCDVMKPYGSMSHCENLASFAEKRHHVKEGDSLLPMVCALHTLTTSYDKYRGMFSESAVVIHQ